ncbi:hypothetical protein CSOJ01_15142 [Colletotrichum sojae]|uniref:Uncharacterized protein n=1 Tax=Colletotrichum sojae TaxID=2175907 RepID=A0A8H6INU1_9PEZI|nr:hypothetical protein CSOJ01_15142 [Colletotrichum sojae]
MTPPGAHRARCAAGPRRIAPTIPAKRKCSVRPQLRTNPLSPSVELHARHLPPLHGHCIRGWMYATPRRVCRAREPGGIAAVRWRWGRSQFRAVLGVFLETPSTANVSQANVEETAYDVISPRLPQGDRAQSRAAGTDVRTDRRVDGHFSCDIDLLWEAGRHSSHTDPNDPRAVQWSGDSGDLPGLTDSVGEPTQAGSSQDRTAPDITITGPVMLSARPFWPESPVAGVQG